MGAIQPIHLIIVLAIILILFGSTKIPQLMRGMGQGMGEFKKGIEESKTPPPPEEKTAETTEEKKP